MLCKAYKSKTDHVQCPNKVKFGNFCGKHKNSVIQINNFTVASYHKNLEKSDIYLNYLQQRKLYVKDTNKDNQITLLEYIENNKLDYYSTSRIITSLEHYKLIDTTSQHISKFILASNNTHKLASLFDIMIISYINIDKIIKLQRWTKNKLKIYNDNLHGEALYDRSKCVNDSDFVSLDEIKDITNKEFVSFKDDTGFIYGFHINSAIELIFKADENFYDNFIKSASSLYYKQYIKTLYNHYSKVKVFNPYTRFIIENDIKLQIITLYAKSIYTNDKRILNNNTEDLDMKTKVRNKCFNIFQKIEFLGYFTNTTWLLEETPKNIKFFYKKLATLWNTEFGLNNTVKYKISKTHNLFNNLDEIMSSRYDKYTLLNKILDTLNILVSNGESESDRNSGCILVLYGLAALTNRCIVANPWLG